MLPIRMGPARLARRCLVGRGRKIGRQTNEFARKTHCYRANYPIHDVSVSRFLHVNGWRLSFRHREQARSHNENALMPLWRGSLLPLGCAAAPIQATGSIQVKRRCLVYDCCAAEREQAPSPQEPSYIIQVEQMHRHRARNDKGHPKVAFVAGTKKSAEAYFFISQPVSSARALPMSASERTVFTPASCSAANFSSAVPLPPEMIAPAWPMRLPGGAVTPAM